MLEESNHLAASRIVSTHLTLRYDKTSRVAVEKKKEKKRKQNKTATIFAYQQVLILSTIKKECSKGKKERIAHLWSQEWTLEFWMQVAGSAKGHDALGYCWDISTLVQVYCLEDIHIWNAVSPAGCLEVVNVFHKFELST